jgi:hypothetical protein
MKIYNIPASKVDEHAPTFANEEFGSSAVRYKPYWLTPTGCANENCTSIVYEGLNSTGFNINALAVPWEFDYLLEMNSIWRSDVKNVTVEEQKSAQDNQNS